ncbi:MAG: FAD-linked oxidase C-terminal domain-containing protein [Pseudomonadales bacterium]|jgi:glycolate oxidase|nr:FAD-linked oxidase C-terminal domain-containing protein [Pseudomonadales bacterium]MDP6471086.1 FAD-linked oxidase C-terminal domain-containing protein [Pseudomonadales bacterium]MDP6825728.1 FAD-linked oxidase C-terminal domain-containing protein [Pseudomonadales bacterium]MDP6970699.1 FAD-linked oxidase C-terminal domain-containing protein [Pseudomonadales bacterium]|tara:strand:- start:219 stop:1673 length:1455 start_codon:yes stop_codon:yes gene_type:complete
MSRSLVLQQLKSILPPASLITDAAAKRPYETDGLTALREQPWVVVLPETEAQVAQVLRICAACEVPVVARGAGTGLSGGARPVSDGVVLGLSKMNRILEIDIDNCVARLQPGVRNLAVTEAAAEYGLYYAPDPSSQIACSIGGNVAENAGGVHCLKYGLTVHNVVGLKLLTVEGEVLELGGKGLDAPGYDLLAVLCGSEGMLGIVTEVVVRLLPDPAARLVMLAAFADTELASAAVNETIKAGVIPAGMEMMDRLAVQAAEDFAHAGYPRGAGAILLIELDGTAAELAALEAEVTAVVRAAGAFSVDVARDAQQQAIMWKGRKSAFPAVGRIAPDYYCMDGTIPRRRLGEVLGEINLLSREYGLEVANVFHAGDGNLHPLILYDANVPGELARVEEMGGRILERCVEVGGTVTGEHGVGVEKLDQMCVQFTEAELRQFERLKAVFDPAGVLNPGKAIPTLSRCAELGGMHVHRGELPFRNLDRF